MSSSIHLFSWPVLIRFCQNLWKLCISPSRSSISVITLIRSKGFCLFLCSFVSHKPFISFWQNLGKRGLPSSPNCRFHDYNNYKSKHLWPARVSLFSYSVTTPLFKISDNKLWIVILFPGKLISVRSGLSVDVVTWAVCSGGQTQAFNETWGRLKHHNGVKCGS